MRFPILMYHRIAAPNPKSSTPGHYVAPDLFSRQLRAMIKIGYQAIPLLRTVDAWERGESPPRKSFAITFDDGMHNLYSNALPILSQVEFPSTVFLVSDLIGKTNEWNRVENDVEESLMSEEEIRACIAARMDFGSHTKRHCNLANADVNTAWSEIHESKVALETLLGVECPLFCFPYGAWRPETVQMVRQAGYRAACSTQKGLNDATTDRFLLKRINVRSDTSVPILLYKLLRGVVLAR